MRHPIARLFALLALVVVLDSCADERTRTLDTSSAQRHAPSAHMPGWGGPTVVERGTDITWSPRSLLDSAIADVDRDGAPERIELYAAVERDRQGRVMFDDGQRWALLVRDGTDIYPLFDGFVQLGRIDFWLVLGADTTPPTILLLQRTPNGVLVQKYVFDGQRRAFVSKGVVDAVGDVMHRPPE
jgi:hypothetical protein